MTEKPSHAKDALSVSEIYHAGLFNLFAANGSSLVPVDEHTHRMRRVQTRESRRSRAFQVPSDLTQSYYQAYLDIFNQANDRALLFNLPHFSDGWMATFDRKTVFVHSNSTAYLPRLFHLFGF